MVPIHMYLTLFPHYVITIDKGTGPARDGHSTLIFVELRHLRSNFDSDFTIQAHLGASC